MATYLSEHFTKEEMIASDTARACGINNEPDAIHLKALTHTCQYLLEPFRKLLGEHFGCEVQVVVTSGYRCPKLNTKIGGSSTSDHVRGAAADVTCYKVKNGVSIKINPLDVYELVKKWVREGKLSVNQCIYEVSGASIWVHVAHDPAGKTCDRREFLKYKNGTYILDCKF